MDTMQKVVGSVGSLLVIMVYLYLGPGVGQKISDAMPINESGDFADATTGAEVWGNGTAILGVVVLIVFIGLALKAIKGSGDSD